MPALPAVVNCFQFVIWRSLTHLFIFWIFFFHSCELLSICDLTIFDTPLYEMSVDETELWIAFNLWFDDLWHTTLNNLPNQIIVVNCFQFVIWRSLTHRMESFMLIRQCCELLSICDLTIFDTPMHVLVSLNIMLWIAFNLWFDDLWHTFAYCKLTILHVVNCFQFVIWRSLTHRATNNVFLFICCELLSICDLTIFDTPDYLRWINEG